MARDGAVYFSAENEVGIRMLLVIDATLPVSVTLARGCRAKGPGIRDSSRASHGKRAGMTQASPPAV